jgi:hypothetical protein
MCPAVLPLLVVMLAATPCLANKGLVCGAPQKAGGFDVNVRVADESGYQKTFTWHIGELIGVDADGKAAIIRAVLNQHLADPDDDTLHCGGEGAQVLPVGVNRWKFKGMWISRDSTYEDDKLLSSAAPTGDWGLCSLSGSASGTAPSGGPGYVRVFAFGATAMVATSPGMPSQLVEQLVMQQLGQQGVTVRPATPADFAGGLETLPHDGTVLFLAPGTPALSDTALEAKVMDDGLILDLAGVDYPTDSVTAVGDHATGAGLRLDVVPSVFTSSVRVLYATVAGPSAARVSVHDVMGRTVRSVRLPAGARSGEWTWDGRDARGVRSPGGVYLVRLQMGTATATRRVVRLP